MSLWALLLRHIRIVSAVTLSVFSHRSAFAPFPLCADGLQARVP